MKTVYSKQLSRFAMYLGLLVLLITKYFFVLDDTIMDVILSIYYVVLIFFFVMGEKNKREIERNEDEMVAYVNSRVNSMFINVSQVFLLFLLCILIAPYSFIQNIPIDRKTVSLSLMTFLTVMSLLRIFLFRYFDEKGV